MTSDSHAEGRQFDPGQVYECCHIPNFSIHPTHGAAGWDTPPSFIVPCMECYDFCFRGYLEIQRQDKSYVNDSSEGNSRFSAQCYIEKATAAGQKLC